MALDWQRKQEYPKETPEALGGYIQIPHTHGGGRNQTPNCGGARKTC